MTLQHQICFLFFCLLPSYVLSQSPLVYQVKVDNANPLVADVSVDTSQAGALRFLPPRFFDNGEVEPILYCHNTGNKVKPISWQVPVQCVRVSWQISFIPVSPEGLEVSQQRNAFSLLEGWHLLTEWNTLPRIQDQDAIRVCLYAESNTCYDLPPTSAAPLFIVSGMQHNMLIDVGDITLNLKSSGRQLVDQQLLWVPVFLHQIDYLKSQFSVNNAELWQLVWFKRERRSGSIGGAAGFHTFLANYPVENGVISRDAYTYLLKISAHEFMHQLFYVPNAIWVNESLAEYYAISSLQGTRYRVSSAVNRWMYSATAFPLSYVGLYDAAKQVERNNNYAYYGLFYTKGAALWGAIDQQLQKKNTRLSQYLSLLENAKDQILPQAFVDAIIDKLGQAEWTIIRQRYLL